MYPLSFLQEPFMRRMLPSLASLAVASVAAATAACSNATNTSTGGDAGSDAGSDAGNDGGMVATQTFTGDIAGTDAEIGLVFGGSKGFVFTCGGMMTFSTMTRWYRGDASLPGPFTFQDSGWTLTGSVHADGVTVTGTITSADGGAPLSWTATTAGSATATGFYAATDSDGTAALLASQMTAGGTWDALGAFQLSAGTIEQIEPLMPIPPDTFRVTVQVSGQSKQLDMARATPF
jgi:hypothetical protein